MHSVSGRLLKHATRRRGVLAHQRTLAEMLTAHAVTMRHVRDVLTNHTILQRTHGVGTWHHRRHLLNMVWMRSSMRKAEVAHTMGHDILRGRTDDFAAHGLKFLFSIVINRVVKNAIVHLEGGGAHEASTMDEDVLRIMLLTDVAEAAILVPMLDDTNFGHIAEVRVFGFTGEWFYRVGVLQGRCD
jgi:hypothetical protein